MFPDWVLIVVYILLGLGAFLLILSFIRSCWYCCVVRREERLEKKFFDNPAYFSAHLQDSWQKDGSLGKRQIFGGVDDLNINEFMQDHGAGGNAKELSANLYHTLTRAEQQIDSETVQTQAQYVEPNTNLIIARKELHSPPPEYIDVSLSDSRTALVQAGQRHAPVRMHSFKPCDSPEDDASALPREGSDDTLHALSALDLVTLGEEHEIVSTNHDASRDSSSLPPGTPHPFIATASEPLPADSEMAYVFASTVYVNGLEQGATQF